MDGLAGHPGARRRDGRRLGSHNHWHPHLHVLLTCGAFTPTGDFVELPERDVNRLEVAWKEAVFALYLGEDKIEPEVVENMCSW